MPDNLHIRPERNTDHQAIRELLTAAFPTDAEARLVDHLREAGRLTLSLVGLVSGDIVGHVAFSPVTLDCETRADPWPGAGLAPVAVAESRRKRGIAAALITTALRELRVAPWVVVLGDPEYYPRFGFVPASTLGLRDEYGGGDAFMVWQSDPPPLKGARGLVRYAPEFAALDENDSST